MSNLDRKVKRDGRKEEYVKKLGEDKYTWAFEVQTKPVPDWMAAFDYAYKLGLNRGKASKN